MNLRTLQKHWNLFGQRDPLWAVLTHPEKKNDGWDQDEFFQTGVSEIEGVLEYVESIRTLPAKKCALDFGCGVGRLTQALALHFEQVVGVDISPSMIEHAHRYNRYGERCQYVLNENPDLRIFPDGQFDFIYSNITLQHMPPRFAKRYMVEFLRVLAPGGLLLFQLPSQPRKHQSTAVGRVLHRIHSRVLWNLLHPDTPLMDMRNIPKDTVVRMLTKHGGQILDVAPDRCAEPDWDGFRYLVTRP